MPTFVKTKTFATNESPIASADLNSIGNDFATFVNVTKLDADNIQDGAITNAKLSGSIAASRLAATTPGHVLLGTTTTGVPTFTALTGDVTVTGAGVTAIGTGKVTSTAILDDTILNADINSAAGISYSKLAALTSGNILVGNGSNVPTSVTPSGDVSITNAGVFSVIGTTVSNAARSSNFSVSNTVERVSGNTTATLPTAVGIAGKEYTVIKTDSNATLTTVATTSSQTICGDANDYLSNQYDSVTYQSDGANWNISKQKRDMLLKSATATSNFTTASTSYVQVTGLAATAYVPAGHRVKAVAYTSQLYTTSGNPLASIWEGVVNSGTQRASAVSYSAAANAPVPCKMETDVLSPSVGSITYNVALKANGGGTAAFLGDSASPAFIEVWAV